MSPVKNGMSPTAEEMILVANEVNPLENGISPAADVVNIHQPFSEDTSCA